MSATSHLPPLGSRSGANWGQTTSSSTKQGDATTSGFDSIYQRNDPVATPPANSFQFGGSTSDSKDSHPATFRRNDSPATSTFSFTNAAGGNSNAPSLSGSGSRLFGHTPPSHLHTGGGGGTSFGTSPSSTFGSRPSPSTGIHMSNESPNLRSSPSFSFTPRGSTTAALPTQGLNSNGGTMDSVPTLAQDTTLGLRRRVGGSVQVNNTRADRPPKPAPPKVSRLGTSFHDHDQGDVGKENHPRSINMHETVDMATTETAIKPSMILAASQSIDISSWVVVYGFTNAMQYKTTMSKFDSFGTIKTRYPSSLQERHTNANWVCLQYQSALQANKAMAFHGTLMDANGEGGTRQLMIIGVQPMTLDLAWKLGLKNRHEFGSSGIDSEGFNTIDVDMDTHSNGEQRGGQSTLIEEADVLLTRGEISRDTKLHGKFIHQDTTGGFGSEAGSGTICEKFLSWVFSWE